MNIQKISENIFFRSFRENSSRDNRKIQEENLWKKSSFSPILHSFYPPLFPWGSSQLYFKKFSVRKNKLPKKIFIPLSKKNSFNCKTYTPLVSLIKLSFEFLKEFRFSFGSLKLLKLFERSIFKQFFKGIEGRAQRYSLEWESFLRKMKL